MTTAKEDFMNLISPATPLHNSKLKLQPNPTTKIRNQSLENTITTYPNQLKGARVKSMLKYSKLPLPKFNRTKIKAPF